MWGLWGGGGNFGIVIEFEFVIYLFGLVVVVGFVVYWLDDGFVVFCGYWQFVVVVFEEVIMIVVLCYVLLVLWIFVDQCGKLVVMIGVVYIGSIQIGIEVL